MTTPSRSYFLAPCVPNTVQSQPSPSEAHYSVGDTPGQARWLEEFEQALRVWNESLKTDRQ